MPSPCGAALRGRTAALLLLSLVALVLTACADEPAPASTPAASATAATAVASAGSPSPAPTSTAASIATPAGAAPAPLPCQPGAALTPAQTEGPYYRAGAPERTSLREPGQPGTRLVISGRVLTADCQPVAAARIDVWQTDDAGQYDNTGFRMRGVLRSGADGSYQLETVVPGEYPGRTPHIHVKVQAPGGPELTTQLYLPDSARNASDNIFDQRLVLQRVQRDAAGVAAQFDFVIRTR